MLWRNWLRRRSRDAALIAAAATLAAWAGCGRTGLRADGLAQNASGPGGAGGAGSGGDGGGGAAPPPPPCVLSVAGEPLQLLSFSEGNAGEADLAVIEPGSAGATARVVHQAVSEDANFWHPELRLAEYTIGPAWPEDVVQTHAPVLAGVDAHGGGRIVPSPGAPDQLGLLWFHGDLASPSVTPGTKFLTWDTKKWSGGDEHFIDETGDLVFGLSAGKSIGSSDEGYTGHGYAGTWCIFTGDDQVSTRVGVIGEDGSMPLGPLDITAPYSYPCRSADVVWTGSRYVVAISHDGLSCVPDADPPCTPNAVATWELVPPGAVQASLEPRAKVPVANEGHAPFRPRLARWGDLVILAWSEEIGDGSARTVRAARLDATGALIGDPVTLADSSAVLAPPAVAAGDLGVVVTWVERGDPAIPPEVPGYGRLVAFHFALDGTLDPGPVEIDVTEPADYLSVAAIASPRAALVSWAGARADQPGAPHVTYLARFDCK